MQYVRYQYASDLLDLVRNEHGFFVLPKLKRLFQNLLKFIHLSVTFNEQKFNLSSN